MFLTIGNELGADVLAIIQKKREAEALELPINLVGTSVDITEQLRIACELSKNGGINYAQLIIDRSTELPIAA